MIDDAENIQTAVFFVIFEEISPVFRRVSPSNGSFIKDDSVVVTGEVSDDVMMSKLTISYLGRTLDITDTMDDSGRFTYDIEFGGYRGDVNITLKGSDNVGLVTFSYIEIFVDGIPDITPPSLRITSPADGSSFTRGEEIRFAGYASDDRALTSLILRSPGETHDLFKDMDVDRWQATIETSRWPLGYNMITVSAVDDAGNSYIDRVKINLLTDEVPFVDREDPAIIFEIHTEDEYGLGEEVIIRGKVIDDGSPAECTLGYSIQSLTFIDITGSMDQDGAFEWEFNTGDIDMSNVDDPELLFLLLSDFKIDFLVVDGAGNERIYTYELSIIDNLPPVLVDLKVEENMDGDISIDLLIRDGTMVTDLVLEVRGPSGGVVSRKKLDNRDLLKSGNDFRYTGNMELYGRNGGMTLHVTAGDRWGNTLEGSEDFFVQGDKDEDVSSMVIIFLGIAALILVLFAIVYQVVRGSRVEKL